VKKAKGHSSSKITVICLSATLMLFGTLALGMQWRSDSSPVPSTFTASQPDELPFLHRARAGSRAANTQDEAALHSSQLGSRAPRKKIGAALLLVLALSGNHAHLTGNHAQAGR
jgi:hypothetical protein